jgi:hypothetical protein
MRLCPYLSECRKGSRCAAPAGNRPVAAAKRASVGRGGRAVAGWATGWAEEEEVGASGGGGARAGGGHAKRRCGRGAAGKGLGAYLVGRAVGTGGRRTNDEEFVE